MRQTGSNAKGFVYFIQADPGHLIKIGFSRDYPEVRLSSHRVSCPVQLRRLGFIIGTMGLERQIHRFFAAARSHGEWFFPGVPILDFIKTHTAEWNPPGPEWPRLEGASFGEPVSQIWQLAGLEHLRPGPTPPKEYGSLAGIGEYDLGKLSVGSPCPLCEKPLRPGDNGLMCSDFLCEFGGRDGSGLGLLEASMSILEHIDSEELVSIRNHDFVRDKVKLLRYFVRAATGEPRKTKSS